MVLCKDLERAHRTGDSHQPVHKLENGNESLSYYSLVNIHRVTKRNERVKHEFSATFSDQLVENHAEASDKFNFEDSQSNIIILVLLLLYPF